MPSPGPTARALLPAVLALAVTSSCLRAWELGGPWACGEGDVCPGGLTCDEGVCCAPGGAPACPTLPAPNGACLTGEARVYFQDADGDGDGNEKLSRVFCRPPSARAGRPRWVGTGTDCDDTSPAIFSGAPERCNGRDDNCDRVIDEGLPNPVTFFRDEDGDGFGALDAGLAACAAPPGFVEQAGDCAALDPAKFPGAPEQCNGLDDDCDGRGDADEGSFVDTDDEGSGAVRFPCVVPQAAGVCRDGAFRCVAGVRTCRSLATAASFDACDGLDNDCDGRVDQQPDCGGPERLIGIPGAVYRAQRLNVGTSVSLTSGCQANLSGTPMAVSGQGKVWSGTTTTGTNPLVYNVWSVEAPPGTFWDLSRLNWQLRLTFGASFTAVSATGGAWGDPDAGAAYNPVVYLCGERDDQVVRYRVTRVADALKLNEVGFDRGVPLNNDSPTWIVGAGSGFDTSRVRRIEVLVYADTPSFTITFDDLATGFLSQ